MTVIILDNATVAMTGGQEVFATGDKLARIWCKRWGSRHTTS